MKVETGFPNSTLTFENTEYSECAADINHLETGCDTKLTKYLYILYTDKIQNGLKLVTHRV